MDDRYQEATEADAAKGRGRGTDKAVLDRDGAARAGVIGVEPPRGDYSGNDDLDGVLEDLFRPDPNVHFQSKSPKQYKY